MHLIFNEPENDPQLQGRSQKLDIVTDGNIPLSRRLVEDERKGLRRLPGRPAQKKVKKTSRCSAVSTDEVVKIMRHTTGGLFATVNMRSSKSGHGNQILQLAEMKIGENKMYKLKLLKQLLGRKVRGKNKRVKVGRYTHDCACTLKHELRHLCDSAHLDSYHGPKHKCGMSIISSERYPELNSQACEQLWAKMQSLHSTISHLGRGKYRLFLKHYCYGETHL